MTQRVSDPVFDPVSDPIDNSTIQHCCCVKLGHFNLFLVELSGVSVVDRSVLAGSSLSAVTVL